MELEGLATETHALLASLCELEQIPMRSTILAGTAIHGELG